MRLGVLAAGAPPGEMGKVFGDYPAMFRHLLGGRGYDWRAYDVQRGSFPAAPEDCDAYVVTGSACGVYDPDPWIGDLIGFLQAAKGRAALVGVCFGHQIMAHAFGGEVIKSPKGWGIGLHTHRIEDRRPWLTGPDPYALPASHQDQVVTCPPDAAVVGGSDFCPMGLIAYADQPAISIQLHPEFSPAYAQALIAARRGRRFSEEAADAAIASLDAPNDAARAADWISAFLTA